MAQVALPVLPPMLYRYRKVTTEEQFERELRAIQAPHLYFSGYKKLNDPMEGYYAPSSRLAKHTDWQRIARNILVEKQGMGICCFSDTHRNELMWTHYADNYAGICVAYRTQQLVEGLPEDVQLVRLAYEPEPPEINHSDGDDPRTAATKILSRKKVSWQYEREWRLLGLPEVHIPITSKGCVRHIYLGSRMDPVTKSKLLAQLQDYTLYVSEMTVDDYEYNWTELKPLKVAQSAA